jgi:hypothetical protein
MSHDEDKIKHSKRLQNDESAIKHNMRIAKANRLPVNETEAHRYVKRNALTCGDSNCVMCMNPRKAWGEKTMQERKFEQHKLYEQDRED